MINTYLREDGRDDAFADVRAFLETQVQRAQALNPQAAPPENRKAG
jgi:hypothetical protein